MICLIVSHSGITSCEFKRFNKDQSPIFRSFVVPKHDQLFTDRLLDYCQLYDFQKIARDLFDSTKTTVKRHADETTPPGIHLTRPQTIPPSTRLRQDKATTKHKSLFSSDEDLLDTPPNFYYSSAKYTKAYREALENMNYYRTTNQHVDNSIDEFELITHPVPVDFSFETDENNNGYGHNRQHSKRTPAPEVRLVCLRRY
jgi:hypothetical protein